MRESGSGRVRGGRDRWHEAVGERGQDSNVDYDRIARETCQAIATDEAEDEQHGDARGDELPAELQTEGSP